MNGFVLYKKTWLIVGNVMDKISISKRLVLSSAAFIALILAIAFFFVKSVQSNIIFAQQELRGDAYQRPLTNILSYLSQLEHDQSSSAKVIASVDTLFKGLAAVDAEHGEALQFTLEGLASRGRDKWNVRDVTAKWKKVRDDVAAGAVSLERLRDLKADIRGMIVHMGDTSNLILDPDLDSYYLMDVTLLALPQAIDRLGVIGADLARLASAGALNEDGRVEVRRLQSMMNEADVARIVADFDTVYKEDANFYGFSPTLKSNTDSKKVAYVKAHEQLMDVMNALASNTAYGVPQNWHSTVQQSIVTANALWNASVKEMDVLLQTRIESYEQCVLVFWSRASFSML